MTSEVVKVAARCCVDFCDWPELTNEQGRTADDPQLLMPKYPNSRGKFNRNNRRPRGPRRNDRIRAAEIRVIGPEGTNLGVMSSSKALELAKKVGLDLIEVSPTARLSGLPYS